GMKLGLLFSAAMCVVLAHNVISNIHPFRQKLVDGRSVAPRDGVVRTDIEPGEPTHKLDPPFAVIARIRNDSDASKPIELRMDDRSMCVRSVSARATKRIDCAWEGDWDPNAAHHLDAVSSDSSWKLTYLEIATHHGATRGYDLVIVPSRSRHFVRPSLAW